MIRTPAAIALQKLLTSCVLSCVNNESLTRFVSEARRSNQLYHTGHNVIPVTRLDGECSLQP